METFGLVQYPPDVVIVDTSPLKSLPTINIFAKSVFVDGLFKKHHGSNNQF